MRKKIKDSDGPYCSGELFDSNCKEIHLGTSLSHSVVQLNVGYLYSPKQNHKHASPMAAAVQRQALKGIEGSLIKLFHLREQGDGLADSLTLGIGNLTGNFK